MATLTIRKGKKRSSYCLTWSDAEGQHRRVIGHVGVLSKREAEGKRLELEQLLARGRGARRHIPSFGEFAEEYLEWHAREYPHSHSRIKQILNTHLVPKFGLASLDLLSVRDVDQYKFERSRAGASVGTITKELRTLKASLHKAVEWGVVDRDPVSSAKPPKQLASSPPHFYTAAELERLYSSSPFHGPIWKLLANTGLRRTEALSLRWQQIDKKHLLVLSSEQNRTKSAKYRKVPISPGAREALFWIKKKFRTEDYVLPRMTPQSLSRAFAKCAARAELNGSLHSLRHTFCTHLAMQGKPPTTIKELAGHSTLRVTEIYMHASPRHMRDSVEQLKL